MLIKFFKIFFLKSNINIVDYIYLKIIEILTSKIQSQKNIINSIDNILKIKYKVDKWKVGKRVFLTDHYYNDDIKNNNKYKFYYINLEENINELSLKINGSLVIINGNDIFSTWGISKYNELVKRCPESIFVLYLYDNHHMLATSALFASLSDYVIVAHSDSISTLSIFCQNTIGPISAPIYSWTLSDIKNNYSLITKLDRNFKVGGNFFLYEKFSYRNQVIKHLLNKYKDWDIGLIDHANDASYHKKNKIAKLEEWTSYKASLIVSTLDDIPIRFFDSMLTGSVPIVNRQLKSKIQNLPNFPRDENIIVWYDDSDLTNFQRVVSIANKCFDDGGVKGIEIRSNWVMNYHMQESVIIQILDEICID
jgi:hypothetical protein